MATIGVIAPTAKTGTTTVVAALADAVLAETGDVAIYDRNPNRHATDRYRHNPIKLLTAPAAAGTTLVDCPPATDPQALDALNECDFVVIVTDTDLGTLNAFPLLATQLRQTNAIALAIVITKASSDKYEPGHTLPNGFDDPALATMLDHACAPATNCLALDYAYVEAGNTGTLLSKLDPPRPDLTNAILSLNDELAILQAQATNAINRPPTRDPHPEAQVRGVANPHVTRTAKPKPKATSRRTPTPAKAATTKRLEIRLSKQNADKLDAANTDAASTITEALHRLGTDTKAGRYQPPPVRGKRLRRTCTIAVETIAEIEALEQHLGWTRAQLINVLLREHFSATERA